MEEKLQYRVIECHRKEAADRKLGQYANAGKAQAAFEYACSTNSG
jgi:hypothetical protein